MIYEDWNDELISAYSRNEVSLASIIGNSQLPGHGLKAGSLLDPKQMKKLREIRNRHLQNEQKAKFIKD